jgi:hypothetical protein
MPNKPSDRRWKEIVVVLIERVILQTCQIASLLAISMHKHPVMMLKGIAQHPFLFRVCRAATATALPVRNPPGAANPSRCNHWNDEEQKSACRRYGNPQGSFAKCTLCQTRWKFMESLEVWVCYPDSSSPSVQPSAQCTAAAPKAKPKAKAKPASARRPASQQGQREDLDEEEDWEMSGKDIV